jgi:uncharacterized protein
VTTTTTSSSAASVLPIAVVGVSAGFLAGLFGVGGGILIVPGLVLATGMDQRRAHGTSLAAVLPISLASFATYASHGNVDWAVAAILSAGAVAGAVVGTHLLDVLSQRTLSLLFAGILFISAIRLFVATDADGRGALTVLSAAALLFVGFVTGTFAGLLGVGGGVVMVPAMILLFGIPPVIAKGTSAAVAIPAALMGTWRNRQRGNADLRAAAIVGVAGIPTAAIGGIVADRMSDDLSNVLFAILLLAVAVRMLWQLHQERRT